MTTVAKCHTFKIQVFFGIKLALASAMRPVSPRLRTAHVTLDSMSFLPWMAD